MSNLLTEQSIENPLRLSAARTVLQRSFKTTERSTLKTRLDQLETGLAALEEERLVEENTALNRSNPLHSAHLTATSSPSR